MAWLRMFAQAFIIIGLALIASFLAFAVLMMLHKGAMGPLAGTVLLAGIASATIATLNAVADWFYYNW